VTTDKNIFCHWVENISCLAVPKCLNNLVKIEDLYFLD
jgi:hypothetical protein